MKKAFIAAVVLSFAGYTNATTMTATTGDTTVVVAANEETRTPVKVEDLPDAVKATLATDSFKDWKATEAFWVENEAPHFEVHLLKGEEKTVVKLNKEGQSVK